MAKTDVIMPQMGESIAEGTIVKWLKKPGDSVKRDEPLFEISTDKVDAEIPSPAAGVLVAIQVPEGQTVEINTVVAIIGDSMDEASANGGGGAAAAAPAAAPAEAPADKAAPPAATPTPTPTRAPSAAPVSKPPGSPAHATAPAMAVAAAASVATVAAAHGGTATKEDLLRTRSTPVVRKIAAEQGIDLAQVEGTGISGRVTKNDLLAYIEAGGPAVAPTMAQAGAPAAAPSMPAAASAATAAPTGPRPPAFQPGDNVVVEPMSVMRKKIAEHMVMSKATSAHVYTLYEIDCSNILNTRKAVQADFVRQHGQKLTITPFVVKAIVEGLRKVPVVNASVDGDNIVYKKDINVGVAVALDWGLIVPVIKHADELSLVGINNRLSDLAARARSKQLKPDEVAGGTFTLTNPGIFGSVVGFPVISQPQVGILGMGGIEKRVKVTDEDAIVIKPMMYTCLSYDHRIVDGAVADQFLTVVKNTLENADFQSLM
jgi:2-oxoglutarate dehydrogenase E2 component (dihydrolipoamide succinyltransferase)